MKIIGIFGEPCTGKSTVMRMLIRILAMENRPQLKKFSQLKYVKIESQEPKKQVVVLGHYFVGKAFEGTDMLSMNIKPHLKYFFQACVTSDLDYILFEGDRLADAELLKWMKERYAVELFRLTAPQNILNSRHKYRKDTQTQRWLQGRKTKIENLARNFPMVDLSHETELDTVSIVNRFLIEISMSQGRLGIEKGAPPEEKPPELAKID